MALALESRRIGDIIVLKCGGRIVGGDGVGAAVTAGDRQPASRSVHRARPLAVESIDSSGLGLLVRLHSRVQNAGGDVKLCAVPSRIAEILRVTKLQTIFDTHESESDAVAAFYRDAKTNPVPDRLATDILCVAPSLDVIAYLREVLRQAGHGVMTSDNLPDALMLVRATRPKLIVMSADFRSGKHGAGGRGVPDSAGACPVVELPSDFSHRDAGDAARRLLEQVRDASR